MKFNVEQKVTGYTTKQEGPSITVYPEVSTVVHYEVTPEDMVELLQHYAKQLLTKED